MITISSYSQAHSFLWVAFNQNSSEDGGEFIILGILIWFLSLFLARWLMQRYVLKLMNKSSKTVIDANPEELHQKEAKAKYQVEVIEVNLETDLSEAIADREKLVRSAYVLFRKKYLYGIISAVLYVIPFFFGHMAGESIGGERGEMLLGFIILYVLYISFNFYYYRKQFRAIDARFGIRLGNPIFMALRKVVNPKWEFFITVGLIFTVLSNGLQDAGIIAPDPEMGLDSQSKWFGWGLVLVSILHFLVLFSLRRKAQKDKNHSLLILRVFGNQKQALLTFGHLTRFWEHFGSWFTIVDPSFIGRKYRPLRWRTLFTLITLFAAAVGFGIALKAPMIKLVESFTNGISESRIEEIAFVPGMIIAWSLYFIYWRFSISRSFAKNEIDIKRRIKKVLKRPRRYDFSFKNIPMFCYDNTWKKAVNELLKNSEVVLMDLRGFSAERKGCQYEVDFIFDNFPINKILFLVDDGSDKNQVKQLILDRWEYLRVHSPNINLENPKARIFISLKGAQDDVQTIIDLLIDGMY